MKYDSKRIIQEPLTFYFLQNRAVTCLSMVVALAVVFAATGCSLLGARRQVGIEKQNLGPEVRDVPFEARGGGEASLRKRVMVLPFINSGGVRSSDSAKVAREALLKQLRKTDEFVVVANVDFPKEMAGYLKGEEYDLEAMAKVAGAIGVSALIEGRVLDVRARRIGDEVGLVRKIRARMNAKVQIRMVNSRNNSIIVNEVREAEVEESTTRVAERASSDRDLQDDPVLIDAVVTRAFQATVPKIVNAVSKLSWEGRVAMIKGEKVYLNAGRMSGLQVGDILRISEEGEDVHDPESGSYIGRVPGRLKGTVEVVSYFGRDGAVAVLHSGSGFKENDLVELY